VGPAPAAWRHRRVGALGNEVAKNLALLGVGRVVLCDPDTVDATNLSRAVLFTPADVGRRKVDAAADALARLAPGTVVQRRGTDLVRGVGLGELADADLVLGCLDSRGAAARDCSCWGAVRSSRRPWSTAAPIRGVVRCGCA
jgi:molybdopterin/thiamine biosynthesis adenylyltransferase